jgi:hypothetical protein
MFDLFIPVAASISLDNVDVDRMLWERVTSTIPVINSVVVGFTSYEDFVKILLASCKSIVTSSGEVITESMTNQGIELYWEGFIPPSTDDDSDLIFTIVDSSCFDYWLENCIHSGARKVALQLTMLDPSKRRDRARRYMTDDLSHVNVDNDKGESFL